MANDATTDWDTALAAIDAVVATRRTVVVDDVTNDPRYLTAFASTQVEIVVPVLDPSAGRVVGTIDVESKRRAAFTAADREATAAVRCASRTRVRRGR